MRRLALLDRGDVELQRDLVADQDATGLEHRVVLDAPVLAVDDGATLEAGPKVAERVARAAGALPLDGDRLGHPADRQVAGHLVGVALDGHRPADEPALR